MLNPFDAYAVAHAVALRADGDEVVAMTMGPPQAEEALRQTLRLGADRAVHLSDRVFAVADTIGTSRTLALALRKLGADLVICGRKTVDAETWQVPPEVAATSWEKPARLGEQPGKSYDCWTAVELAAGRPTRLSLELLAKGRELAGKLGGRNVALVLGDETADAVREVGRHGAEVVVEASDPSLREDHPERWSAGLRQVLERERPHALLIPASA